MTLTTSGTGLDGIVTIASTIVDTDTDDQGLTITGTGPTYTIDIDGGSDVIIQGAGINTLSESPANTLVITGTEVDGSTTNELQTIANTSDATSHTQTLSNSGGSTQYIEGTGITITTGGTGLNGTATIATTALLSEVDGSTTNEIQTLSASGTTNTYGINLSLSGGTVNLIEGSNITIDRTGNDLTLNASASSGMTSWLLAANGTAGTESITDGETATWTGAGINTITRATNTITVTGTEVDGSTTNELQTLTITGAASPYTLDISGVANDVDFSAGGIVALSEPTANTLLISATEVDGSITNEGQWIIDATTGTTETVANQTINFAGEV